MNTEVKEYQTKIAAILVRDYFPVEDDWEIECATIPKNNDTKKAAIIIRERDEAIAAMYYVEGFMERDYTPEAAAHYIYEIYQKEEHKKRTYLNFAMDSVTDLDKVKDRICYKIVNTKANQSLLQEAPNIVLAPDLALCFYIRCDHDATITINDKIVRDWGIPKDKVAEQLYEIAEANIERTKPAVFCSMLDILKEMLPPELYEDAKYSDTIPLYVLTNKNKVFGAAAIAYGRGQVLSQCLEKIENAQGHSLDGIYIIPSSIHETILVSGNGVDVQQLHEMVKEVNRTQVAPEERLSDEVFYFDKKEGLVQLTFNVREISR